MGFESEDFGFFESKNKDKKPKKMRTDDEFGRSFNNNRKKNKPRRGRNDSNEY